jgi:hypothetical protein
MLAERGDEVVVVARRAEPLEAFASEFPGTRVVVADLSTVEGRDHLVAEVPQCDVLVNNAGFGTSGLFAESELAVSNEMVQLNVAALTDLTGRYLPAMIEHRRGRVLNIASTAAFQPGPSMAVYCATKAYVLSFTEAVAHELRGTGVTATAFCPGAFSSGFQKVAGLEGSKFVSRMRLPSSQQMARDAVAAMDKGQVVRVPGAVNKVTAAAVRVTPRALVRHTAGWALK